MHVGVDFSGLFVIFSLYFGRKWAETGERLTATTTNISFEQFQDSVMAATSALSSAIQIRFSGKVALQL